MSIQKKKSKRCGHPECRRKLMLTDMPCKCGIIFCSMHRLSEQHDCTFDFKKASKDETDKKSEEMRCVAHKIEGI